MKIHLFFGRIIFVLLVSGFSPFLNSGVKEVKLLFEAVEKADVLTVQKLLKFKPSLADCRYNSSPILWGLLQATRLENKVEKAKREDYAKIVGLLGKSATQFILHISPLHKKVRMLPSTYSLLRCYSEIDKALSVYQEKPKDYTPQTEGKKESIEKMVSLSNDVVVPFLKKTIEQALIFFDKELKKRAFAEIVFDSGIKDAKNRPLFWTLGARKLITTTVFFLELHTEETLLCRMDFNVLKSGPALRVYIAGLKSPQSERQNGYARLVLGAVIKAFAQVDKKVYVWLVAEPQYEDEHVKKMYLPRLIGLYKSLGFRVKNLTTGELFLWLVDGKVQEAWEPGALTCLQD
ncbi:TPA: hypothetical protein DDZ86_00975 [Candidatus Dependentiae bacterium]|nr:MAG: hypothetical protein UW09_C0004G0077 [candidate division TM6 bacterium GW2011_GWF2_43_87]HBL98198.1 hypothetical protein [Candidatus Dependentiae bacterium]